MGDIGNIRKPCRVFFEFFGHFNIFGLWIIKVITQGIEGCKVSNILFIFIRFILGQKHFSDKRFGSSIINRLFRVDDGNIVKVVPDIVLFFDVAFESSFGVFEFRHVFSANEAHLSFILFFDFFIFSKRLECVDYYSRHDFSHYSYNNKKVKDIVDDSAVVIPLIKEIFLTVRDKSCRIFKRLVKNH